jgi:molybdopterin synthase catalytic subunit
MLHAKVIDSKNQKIEIKKAEEFLKSSRFGALIYFVGTVRNINDDKKVTGITYDSKDSLVIKSFEEIYNEADEKLNIKDKAVFIEHIKGYVSLEEKSILIF